MRTAAIVLLIALIFLAVEMMCLWTLAKHVGFAWLIAALLIAGVGGAVLIAHSGLMVWRRTWLSLCNDELPSSEVINGLIVYAAGIALLLPGLLSDAVAITLLIKPTRRKIESWVTRRLEGVISRGGLRHLFGD